MSLDVPLVVAAVLSGTIGLSLGVFGGGGSILALPVLVYVAGIAPSAAVGMSLAIVGTTSLLAGFLHRKSGNVDLRIAAMFAGTGMVSAFLGARFTHLFSARTLMLLFAGLMFVVGASMITGFADRLAKRRSGSRGDARPSARVTLLAGSVVGVLTGFLGVGGGFLIVPALVLFTGLPMNQAVGTSLIVIALNSASGFISHLEDGEVDILRTGIFTAAALLGSMAGHRLASRLHPARLRRGFAGFVVVVGSYVALKTIWFGME